MKIIYIYYQFILLKKKVHINALEKMYSLIKKEKLRINIESILIMK